MKPIIMPQVGQDLEKAVIVEWLKEENDSIEEGEVILVVESEKATFEVEAEEPCVLLKILYPAGREVDILTPVGYTGQAGESVDEGLIETPAAARPEKTPAPAVPRPSSERPAGKLSVSPAAKRLAAERGVDLATLKGSGPGGRIVKRDVLGAAGTGDAEASGAHAVVPCGIGKISNRTAERSITSRPAIPHVYLTVDVDMTDALQWRRSVNADQGADVTMTGLIVQALAAGLREFPRMNAHVSGNEVTLKKDIHIGLAASIGHNVPVPAVPHADQKQLREISAFAKRIIGDARRGVVDSTVVGTFTVTSLAMYGVKEFLPTVHCPECGILAVGSVRPCVMPVPDGIGARQIMTLTVACDHRAVDETDAAGLLRKIKECLETPLRDRPGGS